VTTPPLVRELNATVTLVWLIAGGAQFVRRSRGISPSLHTKRSIQSSIQAAKSAKRAHYRLRDFLMH
jgi:hypothetical protein